MRMNRVFSTLMAGLIVLGQSQVATAQAANAALNEAKARLACGAGTVVAAQYLPGGALKVTCSRPPTESNPPSTQSVLEGTGLTTPATLSLVASVIVLTIALGGENTTTTTSPDF